MADKKTPTGKNFDRITKKWGEPVAGESRTQMLGRAYNLAKEEAAHDAARQADKAGYKRYEGVNTPKGSK